MDSTLHLNPLPCKRSLEKGRHKTEIASTAVLLICIYNRNNSIISHNLLYSVFSPFGPIAKILIFEKGTVWKVFVEYKCTNSAIEAKQALDDALLMENGPKIKIYFSNLRKIKFQNGNPGGKAYEVQSEENEDSFYPGEREEAFGLEEEGLWEAEGFYRRETKENSLKGISYLADEEDKEDDIFHLINNLEEKEEMGEAPEEEDLEKDGFNEMIMKAFNCASPQQKQANTSFDLKVWEQYVKNSSADNTLSYCFPSLEIVPRKSLNDESYSSIGGTHFPLSRCSTLSDLPVHGLPKLNPLSKVTSCEEISFTKRTPKRFHTAQALHSPQANSEEIGLFRETFVNSAENSFLLETSNQAVQQQQQRSLQSTSAPFVLQKMLKECDGNKMNKHASNAPSTFQKNNNNNFQEKPSQVLYVKGLDNPEITTQMLSNLFGNFGNIMKVILLRNKSVALIEFESIEHSTMAKNSLNNLDLMDFPLQITYSNYPTISLKGKRNSQEQEEIYIGNPKNFRLNRGKNFSVNPPSSTLHLFNLTKESCFEDQIRDFIQPLAAVEKIKILSQDNTRNGCLVQLYSIEDSVNVLASLHDATLDGRKIQISFAHSKI